MPRRPNPAPRPTSIFNAFLSHRYKSPDINLHFFKLFAERAVIQFTVDRGSRHLNVTRLERLMRDADAFVGIYSLPHEKTNLRQSELEREARYFKLELDLAERSRKPAIVFIDSGYGGVIDVAPSFIRQRFDSQEILVGGPTRHDERFRRAFRDFHEQVRAAQAYGTTQLGGGGMRDAVGILLPDEDQDRGYTRERKEIIRAEVAETGRKVEVLEWPPRLDMSFVTKLEQFDWMIIDVGPSSIQTGVVGYLHGRFIPSMRLLQTDEPTGKIDLAPATRTLYGAHEVGYPKDILRWNDDEALRQGVRDRIQRITDQDPSDYIGDRLKAEQYFLSAAKRKEGVFVSYSGEDRDLASGLIGRINARFQEVFDYRERGAIRPGTDWMDEMFRRLSASAVGIPLLSRNYFNSPYCPQECQRFMDGRAQKRMHVIPIKLRNESIELPEYIKGQQYLRLWEYKNNEAAVVDEVVRWIDA
jgi:TIR domain